jgi:hypothetical protein
MDNENSVNPRVLISGLWVTMLFVFAYVDIFALFRADVLENSLAGKVPPFDVSQTFLALTTLYILIPSLMIVLSLILPRKINRPTNIVLAILYAMTIVGGCIGETWIYYLLGSAVEIILLALIAWKAWKVL